MEFGSRRRSFVVVVVAVVVVVRVGIVPCLFLENRKDRLLAVFTSTSISFSKWSNSKRNVPYAFTIIILFFQMKF
jgi:hypothetical protein